MRASYPPAIGSAACAPRFPIFQIAPVASSRRSRRDGGCRHLPGVLRFPQFRLVALAGADLIAGVRSLAGLAARLGARVQRVFAVLLKGSVSGVFHVPNVDHGASACPTSHVSNPTPSVPNQ